MDEPQVYLELSEFKLFIKLRVAEEGGIPQFAKKYGISRPLVYVLLSGERQPSKALIKKMGGRFVIAIGGLPKKKK
jgi:DNA-binding phage protein